MGDEGNPLDLIYFQSTSYQIEWGDYDGCRTIICCLQKSKPMLHSLSSSSMFTHETIGSKTCVK